jgi:amidase
LSRNPLDAVGAFVIGPDVLAPGAPGGPLAGRTFAAKDLLDVEGWRTGGGNPDWLADSVPAPAHATAVKRLLDAGATLVGKTHTDELAYSLAGTNVHYGTPRNVMAPGRIPGGSSSGSAAAVAAALVDLALGTDTGGSIRVPASYCGVFGLRPSWGRVPVDGVMALAPSYDTVGILTREPVALRDGARALFGGEIRTGPSVESLVVADDAWAVADPAAATALHAVLGGVGLTVEHVHLADGSGGLASWVHAFRVLQGFEAWATFGEWISRRQPAFGVGVAERFRSAAALTLADVDAAQRIRDRAAARLRSVLDGRRLLAIPSAPGPAPRRDADSAVAQDVRQRTLQLTCVAGHAGAPAVSVPVAIVDGAPVGLSLIGTAGLDEQVLDFAVSMWLDRRQSDVSISS